jgi:hypothetical protein
MQFLVEVGQAADTALSQVRSTMQRLGPLLRGMTGESVLVPSNEELSAWTARHKVALLITEGMADLRLGGFPLVTFEDGDIVGPQGALHCGAITCNFAIKGHAVPWPECEKQLKASHEAFQAWFAMLHAERALLSAISAEFMSRALGQSEGAQPLPVAVQVGEVLIQQGDSSDEVFTLIEGQLEVRVDGVAVGKIEKDEIFGVISAMADAPRSASVVASTPALVLKLPKEEFLQLMRARPRTVIELVKSMSRALISANEKVVDLTRRLTT